jgi:hypothetical protein
MDNNLFQRLQPCVRMYNRTECSRAPWSLGLKIVRLPHRLVSLWTGEPTRAKSPSDLATGIQPVCDFAISRHDGLKRQNKVCCRQSHQTLLGYPAYSDILGFVCVFAHRHWTRWLREDRHPDRFLEIPKKASRSLGLAPSIANTRLICSPAEYLAWEGNEEDGFRSDDAERC